MLDSDTAQTLAVAPRRSQRWLSFARAQPLGALALLVIVVMLAAGALARYVAPYDPLAIDFGAVLSRPSALHPFGTDSFGRDLLSRVIYGARTALIIGFTASLFGSGAGTLVGITSAFYGGWIDLVVQRFIDMLLSFPIIVLALVVVAMLGRHLVLGVDVALVLAIAIPVMPQVARVVRSAALAIRGAAYVDAARIAGLGDFRIILRHILPNVMAPFLIMLTAFIGQAILLEASLSFLGLGVSEPTPAWGLMLAGNAADFYREAPWLIIFPGAAISLAVFAFNFLGDSLRDWLDPRLRR
jgi:peptide/nickel transport system permease protein